jgi:hypothetical protein
MRVWQVMLARPRFEHKPKREPTEGGEGDAPPKERKERKRKERGGGQKGGGALGVAGSGCDALLGNHAEPSQVHSDAKVANRDARFGTARQKMAHDGRCTMDGSQTPTSYA